MRMMLATRTGPFLLALLLGTLLGAPLSADDVYLKNGRSFENVVAEVGDTQVRIHLPGGVISLPRAAVDRVQKADSSFPEYLRRKQELERRTSQAADWVELARWARGANLPQAAREAALAAAEINPREPGLAALLRASGYVYEESLDRYIPYDDSMRLHGFVQEGGHWVSREEHAERVAQRQAAAAQELAAREAAAAEMLRAELDLAQQGAGYAGYGNYGGYDNGYGGGYTLGGYYGYWPFGGSSVFAVPGFGFGARHRFPGGERGEARERHERREHREGRGPAAFGGTGRRPESTSAVFGVPGARAGRVPPPPRQRSVVFRR